jgi:quercetin dioxygenase-like cupin family protein
MLLGDVRTLKATSAETAGQLTVVEQVVEPGGGAGLHRHPYQEFFYVLEGELEFSGLSGSGRDTFAAPAGTSVHAGSGVAHGYRNRGSERARFLAVIQPSGVEEFFDEAGRWLDEDAEKAAASPDEVRAAAARHGIEFLTDL